MKDEDLIPLTWAVCPDCSRQKCLGRRACPELKKAYELIKRKEKEKNHDSQG